MAEASRQAKPAASVEEHAFILGCFRANSPKTSLPRARKTTQRTSSAAISPHCIAKTVGPADKCTSCRYRICHIKDSRSDAEYRVRLKKQSWSIAILRQIASGHSTQRIKKISMQLGISPLSEHFAAH